MAPSTGKKTRINSRGRSTFIPIAARNLEFYLVTGPVKQPLIEAADSQTDWPPLPTVATKLALSKLK